MAPRPSSAAVRRRERTRVAGSGGGVTDPSRAALSSAAVAKRSVGSFASALASVLSTASGISAAPGADRRQRRQHLLRHDRLRGRPGERRRPAQHLIEHAAEAVDVAPPVHLRRAAGLLRAHVGRRPDGEARLGEALVARGLARGGDAEVGHDGLVAVEQDVLGLDVAVDDAVPVRVVQREPDLAGDADGGRHREPPLALQPPAQGLARHVRHHVIEEPVGLARVEERQDVGVGEAGDEADLAEEALGAHRGRELRVDHLERDRAVMPEVVGEENRRGAAAAEKRQAPVGPPLDPVALLKRHHETFVHGHRHWTARKLHRQRLRSTGRISIL